MARGLTCVTALLALTVGTALPAVAAPLVFAIGGTDGASILPTVDAFRAELGALNPNPNPGVSFPDGRREINWDAVPDARAAPNLLPADFFNVNSPRGAVFSGPGTGFQVSANAGVAPIEFGNLNPTYPDVFSAFSAQRLFTSLGSNVYDVSFFLPGTSTAALTRGFGAVFTDVDLDGSTRLDFFDSGGHLLFGAAVLPGGVASGGLSFLGAAFATPRIARVRVTSGNAALGAGVNDGGATDLVVVDDFIYGEPGTVPEPGSLLLLVLGAAGLGMARRRR